MTPQYFVHVIVVLCVSYLLAFLGLYGTEFRNHNNVAHSCDCGVGDLWFTSVTAVSFNSDLERSNHSTRRLFVYFC